jgi:hypothetical protein
LEPEALHLAYRYSLDDWAVHSATQCLAYRWLAGWAARSEPEALRLAYRYSLDDWAAHSAPQYSVAQSPASPMADDRCAGYSAGRSTESHLETGRFADGWAARCSAAQYLQAVRPDDCLAERCFAAAASAGSRSDLRSAVAHFRRPVAAALQVGTKEPS